jgi:hypothetical protein
MATPAQPIPVLVNRARKGKLNSDTDILELKEGDYPDRVNVEFNADGELFSDTPALGNKLACDIGIQQPQQQQTRIYIDFLGSQVTIIFRNRNGVYLRGYSQSVASQSIQGMKDAIAQAISGITIDYTYSVFIENQFSPEPYIDITINCAYSDYTLNPRVITPNGALFYNTAIIKEAISITGAGSYIEIGSKDLLGTTWIFSTTQDKEQTSIYDASMSMYVHTPYGGQIAIYFPNHGLVSGESIVIANAVGVGINANGQWVVNYIDQNNFGLFLSFPQGFTTTPVAYGGIIYKNTFGVGQIGVQQYVGETDSYTYTRILASKRFNFRTMYQIDADAVLNNNGYLLKYTDNYNYPRTFSYRGEFIQDGALQTINPDGFYTYETLADEIKNIINYSAAVVKFEEQIQGGGQVPPANWRYGVLFYTDTNSATELSFLSNPIPTYPPAYQGYNNPPVPIYGAAMSVVITPKINRVRVTGINPGIFKYIELIGFNYGNSSVNTVAVNAFRIRKELLGPDQAEIILEHNGNEPDISFYDTTASIAVRPDIVRAGSNRFCENRLVYGNVTTSTEIDIRDWALTMKYSIKYDSIIASFKNEMYEEFYNPANTPKYTGYQPYEWYRFYISAETYSGKITDSVFAFDMRFLTQYDYNLFGRAEFNDINGGDRRVFTGDQYFTYQYGDWSVGARRMFQLCIELNNIDWDYQINGVKAKDIFKSVKVSRAERIKEVLAAGTLIQAIEDGTSTIKLNITAWNQTTGVITVAESLTNTIYQGDLITVSITGDVATYNTSPTQVLNVTQYTISVAAYTTGEPSDANNIGTISIPVFTFRDNTISNFGATVASYTNLNNANPFLGSFYSPDILFGVEQYNFVQGDKYVHFGNLDDYDNQSIVDPNCAATTSWWRTWRPNSTTDRAISMDLLDAKNISYGQEGSIAGRRSGDISGGQYVTRQRAYRKYITAVNSTTQLINMTSSPVLSMTSGIGNFNSFAVNNGLSVGLLFRSKKDKYGARDAFGNTIVFTGATAYSGDTFVRVNGGDVFCQQYIFKPFWPVASCRQSSAYNLISTNIVNVNLPAYDPNNPVKIFPQYPFTSTAEWLYLQTNDPANKNMGYSIFNQVQASSAFDPEGNNIGNYITRKYYSQLNPNNSNTDKYREFMPFDFQDNPNSFGPITHLEVVNGELFTFQQRGFTREFFNATGRLQSAEDGDLLIGDGSVLSRKGLRLTMLGTNQKWSVCKGFTTSGKETVIWVNDEFGCVVRFGADGTVNISEREMMSTFFRERMRFVIGKDTPADNQGISTVWDNIGKNFIITQRAWKDTPEWIEGNTYVVGNSVILNQVLGVPQIYVCLADNTSDIANTPGSSGGASYWKAISIEDLNYYNTYTIVFNEQKNSFTHRYTFYPKIYHTQNNRYFSPSPYDGESNIIYRKRDKDANELTFYGRENIGFSEYIINYMPRIVKKFIAHAQTALLKPKRVEFETQFISENGIDNRKTYLDRADFTMRENQAFSNIKNNLDSQGRNDQPRAPMTGLWLKIRTFFAANEKQKINDTTVVIRTGQRNVENP